MNLKQKLVTAFFIIMLLPILLITAVTGMLAGYQANSIEEDYGYNMDSMSMVNPIQLLNRATRGVYNEVKLKALKDPAQLQDAKYLNSLNDQLTGKYSFLLVRKNHQYIYCGNLELLDQIEESLPRFGVYSTDVDGGIYIGESNPFLVKQQDFYFPDGTEGSVFVISNVNVIVPQIKWFLIQFLTSLLVIMFFTAAVLLVWIYSGILRPLNKLRRATYELREGNLNYAIQEQSDDEIGQLCSDFEDMRMRLKELIEAQLQNEKASKELLSNISHDLKTPLTAIKGYTEGILDGVADAPEKREKYLKTIYKKASDMTVLVDELLVLSKMDANTMTYNFIPIDIGAYFDDCIEEYSLDVQEKNMEIIYTNHISPGTKVIADPEQLKRVVNNIIGNALKYMDKRSGKLIIVLTDRGDDVQIEISDNGEGISEKDLPFIFERFYRADASRNSKKGGSGLGLAIVKKIIEEHDGQIWAESVEKQGTTIGFTLKKVKEEHNNE